MIKVSASIRFLFGKKRLVFCFPGCMMGFMGFVSADNFFKPILKSYLRLIGEFLFFLTGHWDARP